MRSSCTRAGLKKEILTPKIQVERISLERQRGGTGRGGGGGGPGYFSIAGEVNYFFRPVNESRVLLPRASRTRRQ